MLSGKDLGRAIEQAIDKKIAKGSAKSKAEIARHFKIKPPSIHDWINKGSISKEKLPELWNYFSDVVGPEHWGLKGYPVNYDHYQITEASIENGALEKLYRKASSEKQAIVDFILLEEGQDPPEWADSDARAYIDSLELKVRRWSEQKDIGKKPKKATA
ncbi:MULTISPECIES: DNA-binding transcriptional repressor RacR [Klebsiella pneumoniae complex]|uniref:DNA-binding transcriptional repressor RacR n=1 Tax=Klebsiella pneumoniae complex TaxID=3390273 RepID=UPI000E2D29D6|nr:MULTISPECIES: hypothetical protein [Klebsiella]HBX1778634.1 hypothetical protein [Klebsiella pneumoniae subsp. pneumoniae]HCT8080196.1 hypothetical protein [Klebsiella variicola]EIX9596861.1 hypothetical protein [Klebsiella pneumoniae]EIX9623745.1 hypothetical protein [Klebsiella pneumoniae]MCI8258390.1 hypothetical protein [Klebsiella pneumoniae]